MTQAPDTSKSRDIETGRKHFDAARKLEEKGQKMAAIEEYEQSYTADPESAETCFHLAFILDLVGEEDEALHLYEQAAQQERPSLNALINLAVMYEDRNQYTAAERCIRQVLNTDPNHPRARLYIKDILAGKSMVIEEDTTQAAQHQSAVLETPVTDFDLSVRTRNGLRKMNIRTLADLLKITEAELRNFKNFGEQSIAEVKAMLAQRDLKLGQAVEQQQSAVKKAVYEQLKSSTGVADEVLNRPCTDLNLSVRARKALSLLSVGSVGDLCQRTEAELMGVKNFGMTSLLEIKMRLAEMGLTLRKVEG
jgi:DNA-directed RNA polymerase subunit alpha